MSKQFIPTSIEELKAFFPVIECNELIKNGYILEVTGSGELELRRYEKGEEKEEECICLETFFCETFQEFIREIKGYVGKKKVYLSKDYALILLATLNGGMPEDYED